MALKIVKASEPIKIERINLCVYAPPGVGKTTLAFTADEPLLLDFDKGVHRAANRKDSVTITSWQDAAGMTADDLAPYRTIVIDTAGRALDFLSADIIRANPKAGRGDGSLTLQGFGTLKSRFGTWMKTLNLFGKDVVLLCHMDEQRSGDDVVERLDVQGGSKGEIYKSVDAMGRIFIRNKERVIDFSPRENSFGKNPASLEVLPIPDVTKNAHFLADVVAIIKERINTLSEEQKQLQGAIEGWVDAINDFTTVDEFNNNLIAVKAAPEAARAYFKSRAKELGMTFDGKSGLYLGAAKPPASQEERSLADLFA
jgi:hypothetical protein